MCNIPISLVLTLYHKWSIIKYTVYSKTMHQKDMEASAKYTVLIGLDNCTLTDDRAAFTLLLFYTGAGWRSIVSLYDVVSVG